MSIKIINKPVTRVVQQPRPFGAGRRWRARNYHWHDLNGAEHVAVFTTGMAAPRTPEEIGYFNSVLSDARKYEDYCAKSGDDFVQFSVSKDGAHFGRGWFPFGTYADEVPFFFTRLLKQGFRGHIIPGPERWEDVAEVLSCFPDDDRPIPPAPDDIFVRFLYSDNKMWRYISVYEGETLPQHLSCVYWAKLADYEKVLATFRPKDFLIYDASCKLERPTNIVEVDNENRFRKIGHIADGIDCNGGGYFAEGAGYFKHTPSAVELALCAAKLAAQGRWMTLVKQHDDDVDADTMLLMSALAPHEFALDDDFG